MTTPRGLESSIELAKRHYALYRPTWPDRLEERVIHFTTHEGRNKAIPGAQLDEEYLRAEAPLRLRSSTIDRQGRLLEAVLLAPSPRAASRLATSMVTDFGVPASEVFILRETPTRFHIVAAGSFRGLRPRDAAALLGYLDPTQFRVHGPATHHRSLYQARLRSRFEELQTMPRARLQQVLSSRRATRSAPQVLDFLETQPNIDDVQECPGLASLLHEDALHHTFPPHTKPTGVPMIPVPGSIHARKQTIIQRIEVPK